MIQTTSSQNPEHFTRSSRREQSATGAITCVICDAMYTPSSTYQKEAQTTTGALEVAFVSMCHFCFRCRRSSCPACWDPTHSVCGECVQEAGLPFRAEASPLEGSTFPPKHQVRTDQEMPTPSPLVCVRPGRFHSAMPSSTDPLAAISRPISTPKQQPVAHEQKLMGHKNEASSATASREAITPPPVLDLEDIEEPVKSWEPVLRVGEQVVTMLLLVILLAIFALIVMAELSSEANKQIVHLLHIDIRSEIAYLVSLIQLLRW